MLGKLFSSTLNPSSRSSASSQQPTTSLESVQEEIHTRNLLFPDANQLYQQHDQIYPLLSADAPLPAAAAGAYDSSSELDLDSRDIRIIIAQEPTSAQNAAVLYDSHPPPPPPQSSTTRSPEQLGSSYNGHSARKSSISFQNSPSIPSPAPFPQPLQPPKSDSVFQRAPRQRNKSISFTESGEERMAKEQRDQVRTLMGCMFGTVPLGYKGSSTKVHMVSSEPNSDLRNINTGLPANEAFGSFGRSENRKSSQLKQSFTPSNPPP